jgi:hypothetical protein
MVLRVLVSVSFLSVFVLKKSRDDFFWYFKIIKETFELSGSFAQGSKLLKAKIYNFAHFFLKRTSSIL